MIKKIIVELTDAEATFKEFNTLAEFVDSDLYKTEQGTEAQVIDVPVEPESVPTPEVAPEVDAPVNPTE